MTDQADLITVYRSADMNAEQDATGVRNLLLRNGIDAQLLDDKAPGVVPGTWEVRVSFDVAPEAERLIADVNQDDPGRADPSSDLDMVTIRRTMGTTGEMEAIGIKSILDANGISAVVVGASTLPNLSFFVTVPKTDVERAEQVILEAQAAGPAAAVEAERESESNPQV